MKKILVMMCVLIFAISFVVAANGTPSIKVNADTSGIKSASQYEKPALTPEQVQNIIKVKNRLRIAAANASECPTNCSCDGSTVKCRLQDGIREMTIRAGSSGNTIVQVKNYNASTQVTLYKSEDGKVYAVFKNNETKEIILPDEVKERIEAQLREKVRLHNENITLNEDGEYQIEARKRARLLWIIPVRERVHAEIDAETGEIIRQRNSWWGFLARDVRDKTNSTE